MDIVHGYVAPGFEPVQQEFERQFAAGDHVGGSVAAYRGAELVVDLWGGVADEASGEPWSRDTMAVCYSTTKGLAATCLHVLADRGMLPYGDPVARHCPEFAAHGKDGITVQHVLTHQAGLAPIPRGVDEVTVLDWPRIAQAMAESEPAWVPGEESGYHALTFGWLAGEIVRRVDGRLVGCVLREEICEPLGIDDMFIGAPPDVEPRIAPLYHHVEAASPEETAARAAFIGGDSLPARALMPGFDMAALLNSPAGHQAEIPAVGGVMTARVLARLYACLANGGALDGVRILSEDTVRLASRQQTLRPDKILVVPIGWAMGYMTGGGVITTMGPRATAFGHPGFGGSIGYADPEIGMSFGFVPNKLTRDLFGGSRASRLADAVRDRIAASR